MPTYEIRHHLLRGNEKMDDLYFDVRKYNEYVDFTFSHRGYKYNKVLNREEVIALSENLEDTVHELLECIDQTDDEEEENE